MISAPNRTVSRVRRPATHRPERITLLNRAETRPAQAGFHVGVRNVAVGQVARERRQFAQCPRGVRGVKPLRVLGARQAADGHRAAQAGSGAVPVRVRGAQVSPLLVADLYCVSRRQAVMAYFRHDAYRKRKTRYVAR